MHVFLDHNVVRRAAAAKAAAADQKRHRKAVKPASPPDPDTAASPDEAPLTLPSEVAEQEQDEWR